MDTAPKPNDMAAATTKLCLALEQHRRTSDGRVRTSEEFLATFFPHDASKSEDRVFRLMPHEVRGPVLAAWGIRGAKSASRDDDEKVRTVVHDALIAGDLDHSGFEEGLSPDVVVRWIELPSVWTFWRGGKQTKASIEKALATAYELGLFDARWLLESIEGGKGKLKGTDVLAEGLSKADLTAWVRKIHESGDGTPKGMLAALGWESVVAKTSNEVLIGTLDALAKKVGLAKAVEGGGGATGPAAEKPTSPPPDDGSDIEVDDSSATEIFTGMGTGSHGRPESVRPEPAAPPSGRGRQKTP